MPSPSKFEVNNTPEVVKSPPSLFFQNDPKSYKAAVIINNLNKLELKHNLTYVALSFFRPFRGILVFFFLVGGVGGGDDQQFSNKPDIAYPLKKNMLHMNQTRYKRGLRNAMLKNRNLTIITNPPSNSLLHYRGSWIYTHCNVAANLRTLYS